MPSDSRGSRSDRVRPLAGLEVGAAGVVVRVLRDRGGHADRLAALGVTPGARVRLLQKFPGVVFLCDETEIAVEREVARAVLVEVCEEAREAEEATPAPAPMRPAPRVATGDG